MKKVYAWHFLVDSGFVSRMEIKAQVGLTLEVKPPLILCWNGLHGSIQLIDALDYAPGALLEYCEYSGKILYGDDKLCASQRKTLWLFDATNLLYEFARNIVEQRLHHSVKYIWEDNRSAVQTARETAAWAIQEIETRTARGMARWKAARTKQNKELTARVVAQMPQELRGKVENHKEVI
jgi:hypothetical protein